MCVLCKFSGNASSLTIEQQRELMEAGMAKAAAATLPPGSFPAAAGPAANPAAVRILPLGQDRTEALFWKLYCAPILAGGSLLDNLPKASSLP